MNRGARVALGMMYAALVLLLVVDEWRLRRALAMLVAAADRVWPPALGAELPEAPPSLYRQTLESAERIMREARPGGDR